MRLTLLVGPSRRTFNFAVWFALSLFYAVQYLLAKATLRFDLILPVTKAGVHIDCDLLLWFVWCVVVSSVSSVLVERTAQSTYRWKWFRDLALVTVLTVVSIAALDVILEFSQFVQDPEAKYFWYAIYTTFLIIGLATNLLMATLVLLVAKMLKHKST